jgi:hypothetical protein
MSATGTRDASDLRAAVRGAVHVPGDAGYDAARAVFNLAVDQRPAVVVEARDARDVVAAVRHAAAGGLAVGAQAGGHGATGDLAGTVLVRTDAMRSITIDLARETARVGAGVRWGELMALAGEHGLIGTCGSSPDVGVVGFVLGGGLSWFGRRHGYAARHAIEFELVGPDGEVAAVNSASDPELLWALRGGGGNFGIVTAVEVQLHRASALYGGQLAFPGERAADVLRAFAAATATASTDSSLTVSLTNVPPLPGVPQALRGRTIVHVGLVHVGTAAEAEALLRPIRAAGGEPLADLMRPLAAADVGGVAMDPGEPLPSRMAATAIDRLDGDAIAAILAAGGPGSPLTSVQVRHLGGALARRDMGAGACGHLAAEFLVCGFGALAAPELAAPIAASLDRLREAFAPRRVGRLPLTFLGAGDDPALAWGDVHACLADVKARRDPDGVFRGNHAI